MHVLSEMTPWVIINGILSKHVISCIHQKFPISGVMFGTSSEAAGY